MITAASDLIQRFLSPFGLKMSWSANWNSILSGTDLVFDVGANYGQTYDWFRSVGYKGVIASFEPDPEVFPILKQRLGKERNLILEPLACSDVSGVLPFNLCSDEYQGVASSLLQRFEGSVKKVVDVKVIRLDEYPTDARQIFLKIDAEGNDLQVFLGAEKLWPRISHVMMEVTPESRYAGEPEVAEVVGVLRKSGFGLSFVERVLFEGNRDIIQGMDMVFFNIQNKR